MVFDHAGHLGLAGALDCSPLNARATREAQSADQGSAQKN